MKNPNCDNEHCKRPDGDVRTLPVGGGGNAILCFDCYLHEMRFRRARNVELGDAAQFDLPDWGTLAVYPIGGAA